MQRLIIKYSRDWESHSEKDKRVLEEQHKVNQKSDLLYFIATDPYKRLDAIAEVMELRLKLLP